MNIRSTLTLIVLFLFTAYGYSQTSVCVIGSYHEANKLVNADTLFRIIEKVKPDLILVELDSSFFTKEFNFDFEKHPDILSTNENIASYSYQQKYQIPLRPYDISGRNEFYSKEMYFKKENGMFNQMRDLYLADKLSAQSKIDFEILLSTLDLYSSVKYNSLKEINADLNQKFTELKYKIIDDLMISIVKDTKDLEEWIQFAQLRKDFWTKRNETMAENIVRHSEELKDKTILVLTGFEHKYYLVNLLKKQHINIVEYWEFENSKDGR